MAKFLCLAMESVSSGSCSISSCKSMFSDVAESNLFCPYIESLYTAGIVSGCQSSSLRFCPKGITQRQEMTKLVCNIMNVVKPGSCVLKPCGSIFEDVSSQNPFCSSIESLYNLGVITGCGTTPLRYCPQNHVSREQMAKYIVTTLGLAL